MANKPTKPNFPLGLESQDQSVFQEGILNNGVIEHGPDAVMTVPETPDASGVPSAVRYNEDDDQFEGYYNEGGWLPLGGGNGGRWELLPYASSSLLQAGRAYLVDNTDGVSTVLFPSPKRIGDSVTVCDLYGKFSTYPLTVDGNGKSIYGSADSMTISTDNVSATFTWTGEARGWVITSGVGLGQGRVYSREIYSQILSATTSSITLSTQPSIVDVYVDGKRLKESLYTLDGYEVKFDPALASGSDVQIIQYIPIQLGAGGGGSGGTVITWEYNGGSAIGGETQIVLDVVVDSVSEIYIRGQRQQIGRGFTFDPATSTITLADELEAGDDVVVVINGDPTVYNQIDRTPWEVARANSVKLSEVILSTDKNSALDEKIVLFDVTSQKHWGIPKGDIPSGSKIISISGKTLTYTGGQTVTLIDPPNRISIRNIWKTRLGMLGLNLVPGSFEDGAQIQTNTDAVISFTDGVCYTWGSDLPKIVPVDSTPLTTGGISDNGWTNTNTILGVLASKVFLENKGTAQDAINYLTLDMYPSVGDGVTDDTVSIQNCIDDATTQGKSIYVRGNKKYKLTDRLNVTCNIIGDGTCTFQQVTDSKSCLEITVDGISVSMINVTPSPVVSSALQFAGIVIKNANKCKVENCNVFYVGRTDREGSGIGIYNGNDNIIAHCRASGANLAPGTRHDYGGNDFYVYGNSSRNRIYKTVGIGANIRGIMQQTTVLGQQCNYNEYDSNISIGQIGYGHICYELNHDSNTSMVGTIFRNGFVANISGSAVDPTSGKKFFGAGVYNQEGQDTRIEGYYIYNVCQDDGIQQTLPMAGISSTRGDIRIKNNFISLSKRCGIKVSTSGIGGDERTASIFDNTVKNVTDEAVYLVNTNRSQINGLNVVNSGRAVRASSNTDYSKSHITVSGVTIKSSSGILLDGFSTAIVEDIQGETCNGMFTAQNIQYLLADKLVSNGDNATGISITSTVVGGFLRNSISVNGSVGFNLAGRIVYERLVGEGNVTNFTGLYSGITTLPNTASVDVKNLNFVAIGTGTDIATITGGVTNQMLTIRATAPRTIVHNTSSIILKGGVNLTIGVNGTLQLWCIDGTRWLEI